MRPPRVGDRVTIAKNLPVTPWVDANELERAVIGGDHRKAAAVGTVEYLTRGPKGLFSVEVRHDDDGNLAPYLVNELVTGVSEEEPSWQTWATEVWSRRVPVGTTVAVSGDDGKDTTTQTRSEAWQLADGTPVVKIVGKAAGYSLRRVLPAYLEGEKKLCFKHRPLHDCAAAPGGDCDGCDDDGQRREIRAQAERNTIAEQLWEACDAFEMQLTRALDVGRSKTDYHSARDRLAAIVREIRRHANPEQLDIAQVVGRLVAAARIREQHDLAKAALRQLVQPPDETDSLYGLAEKAMEIVERAQRVLAEVVGQASLEAQVDEAVARLRGNDSYIRCEEHKAVEEVSVILAKLAPELGSASLKEQAEEIRRRFGDFAVALGLERGQSAELVVAAAEQLVRAHHKLVRGIAGVAATIAGMMGTPLKLWRKKALYHHLEAVQCDLQRAVNTAEKGGAACPD